MATAAAPLAAELPREGRRDLGPLFVGTIFLGSFLLFLVQPMVARMALPRLGGAPAVWNSAMLVYQALLLAGYAYAHLVARLPARSQAIVHLSLLALAALTLPLGLAGATPSGRVSPALWVPGLLLFSIGPLFFAVAAQAPLVQRWYSVATGGRDPYPLYAASNLGSFTGLLSYPLLVEPRLALAGQAQFWSLGYAILGLMMLACALALPRAGVDTSQAAHRGAVQPRWPDRLLWIALAFVPSGLILSTTTFLTTDIVAVPLLWVAPLGLYLLSFTIAFAARRGAADAIVRLAPVALLAGAGLTVRVSADQVALAGSVALALLFLLSVALHARMYDTRPAPEYLTGFYLCMAAGGALGGIFAGLVAPLVFDWSYEHPALILLAAMLLPQRPLLAAVARLWAVPARARLLGLAGLALIVILAWLALAPPVRVLRGAAPWLAVPIGLIGLVAIGRRLPYAASVAAILLIFGGWEALELSAEPGARHRSYFGIYTVSEHGDIRVLAHGTTSHGLQKLVRGFETDPTSYYGPRSGVGQALTDAPQLFGPGARIGIVGLGTGTLACYARPGQDWRFFEIDPLMVRIARERFSFLDRCRPDARILLGDARLSLSRQPPGRLDLLALDAFSSDAVPMHLLTREAFGVYARALAPDGLLLVHISNRHLDLEPVVAAAARDGGWSAALHDDWVARGSAESRNLSSSIWIALSRDPATLGRLINRRDVGDGWRPLTVDRDFPGWSDDYGSILPVLKLFRRESVPEAAG